MNLCVNVNECDHYSQWVLCLYKVAVLKRIYQTIWKVVSFKNRCEIRIEIEIEIEINSKRETLWPRSAIKTHFLPDLLHGLHTKRRLRTRTYFIHSIFCENVFSYFGGDCHSWCCCQHEMWSSRCHLSPCKISHHKEEQKGKSEVEQLTG